MFYNVGREIRARSKLTEDGFQFHLWVVGVPQDFCDISYWGLVLRWIGGDLDDNDMSALSTMLIFCRDENIVEIFFLHGDNPSVAVERFE